MRSLSKVIRSCDIVVKEPRLLRNPPLPKVAVQETAAVMPSSVQMAREEAKQLIRHAKYQAGGLFESSQKQGFAEGYTDGYRQCQEKADEKIEVHEKESEAMLAILSAEFEEKWEETRAEAERQVRLLACAIASKVLGINIPAGEADAAAEMIRDESGI